MVPLFMRRPVQRKYAAEAAHGSRGEQGRCLFLARLHGPACPIKKSIKKG